MNVTGDVRRDAARLTLGVLASDPLAVILFGDIESADANIAGLPAAARALNEMALAGIGRCVIAVPGGWTPHAETRAELDRLAGKMAYVCIDSLTPGALGEEPVLVAVGTRPFYASDVHEALDQQTTNHPALAVVPFGDYVAGARFGEPFDPVARRGLSDAVLATTVKPGDGIVSRYINRPISMAISRRLLRFPSVRPIHATYGTAAIALLMFGCLLLGGQWGLIAGAVLFQIASIFDGVDGEIARATFRTSARGAMLDSVIDAVTNIAFIGGVALNLYFGGNPVAAVAGGVAMGLLATGLTVIGRSARSSKGPFTFNVVKERVGAGKSRVMQWLTWLTMRDFFALGTALLIIAGFAPFAMFAFAAVTAGWLVVVLAVLLRRTV